MSAPGCGARAGSYEYATASRSAGRSPASLRQNAIARSGSSQVEKATGGLPCFRREKRSSSAAATVSPSTSSAAAGSWKTALIPRTTDIRQRLSEKRFSRNGCGQHANGALRPACDTAGHRGDRSAAEAWQHGGRPLGEEAVLLRADLLHEQLVHAGLLVLLQRRDVLLD